MSENRLLESAKKGVGRKGKNQLIKHLMGGRLQRREAIWAKCYDCNGMGEQDSCDITDCALYPHSQFRGKANLPSTRAPGSTSGRVTHLDAT